MIIKGLAVSLVFLGSIGLANADYADAMRYYERQEYRQALQEFSTAAKGGDADAQYMLGRLHEAGSGTPQDFVQAHQWYNLSAARGHRHAAEARDALTSRMTAGQIAEAQQAARAWKPEQAPSPQATSPSSRPDIDTLSDRQGIAEIQRELNRLGYDAGPVDGAMGRRTRNAIREYQADMDVAQDGLPTSGLLRRLRQTERVAATEDSPPPPTASPRIALQDDFSDGDYRRNPAWTVLSGDFEVDDNGLRSIVATQRASDRESRRLSTDRPEEIGLAMLELILEQTGNVKRDEVPTAVKPAHIFVNAPVGNAFRLELQLASRQQPGSLEVGLFQGNRPNGTGYRLVYSPGSNPGLSLVRLTSGSVEVIARQEGQLELEDGRFHSIVWTRDKNGEMQVHVDDRRLLRVRDTGLRDPFQGFLMANQGGDYTLDRVRLQDR
ncbi:MAG: SEL1-like repeat protein [Halomonas sp.]|nr:SEL1-like repeat protein [Halomonas sp.]